MNEALMAFVIIGVLAYSIFIAINETEVLAQAMSNQTIGSILAREGVGNQTIGSVADIQAQPGVADENRWAYVKIVSTCKLINVSCAGIVDDTFRIYPSLFVNNRLIQMDSFPASERGRVFAIDTFQGPGGPIQYQIKTLMRDEVGSNLERLFYVFPYYSYDCEGEIQAGQTKECTINTDLLFRN